MDRWKLMRRIKKNLNDAGQMRHLYPLQVNGFGLRQNSLHLMQGTEHSVVLSSILWIDHLHFLACPSYADLIVPGSSFGVSNDSTLEVSRASWAGLWVRQAISLQLRGLGFVTLTPMYTRIGRSCIVPIDDNTACELMIQCNWKNSQDYPRTTKAIMCPDSRMYCSCNSTDNKRANSESFKRRPE